MMTVQVDGQGRAMVFLPRRSIPMWAATIDAGRVAEHVRTKIVAYQNEAADVLAEHFLGRRSGAGLTLPAVAVLDMARAAAQEGRQRDAKVLADCAARLCAKPRGGHWKRSPAPAATAIEVAGASTASSVASGNMTTEEYRAAVERLGGQNAAATATGWSRPTIHAYYLGKPVHPELARSVRDAVAAAAPLAEIIQKRDAQTKAAGSLGGRPRNVGTMTTDEFRAGVDAFGSTLKAWAAMGGTWDLCSPNSMRAYSFGHRSIPQKVADAMRAALAKRSTAQYVSAPTDIPSQFSDMSDILAARKAS